MSLVSVIIPIYNAEKHLCKCIDSVLAQSLNDIKVILINDGSTDTSGDICNQYALRDSRVVVLNKENGGVSSARNVGIRWVKHNSASKWITFVDSDDTIHPNMLTLLYNAAVTNNADISICGVGEVQYAPSGFINTDVLTTTVYEVNEDYIDELYAENSYSYWTAWAKLLQLDIVDSLPFEEGRIYEDNGVVFQWLCSARRIARMDEIMYFYYINPAGISKNLLTSFDYLHALKRQIDYYKTIGYLKLHKKLCTRYVHNSAWLYYKFRNQKIKNINTFLIRWQVVFFWLRNKASIDMEEEQKTHTIKMFFPKCSYIVEKCHNLKCMLLKDGISKTINRIWTKLRGRGADEYS